MLQSSRKQTGFVATIYLLGALLLAATGSGWYMTHQNNKIRDLTAKVTLAEQFILQAQVINAGAVAEIENLRIVNDRCANQRLAAETAARRASEAIESAKEKADARTREEAREIRNETSDNVCSMAVPARTTELLVAAAVRANEGSGDK